MFALRAFGYDGPFRSPEAQLLMTDVSPSELTVLQGCVQVQVEVGGSWRDGGDDGALAFLPLSPPPR